MNRDKYLHLYLHDHYAGSEGGLRRFIATARRNRGTDLASFLERCVGELREERRMLRDLLAAVGSRPPYLKRSLAAVGERVARLKPNAHVLGYSPLSRLEDLEALCLGVTGKRALWRSLEKLARTDQRLAGFDFRGLEARADSQLAGLERFRLDAAGRALSRGEAAHHLGAHVPAPG